MTIRIPQGGGEYETTHRCPGEQLTIVMKLSLEYLLNKMDYEGTIYNKG